ncbi:hypothetical protein [Maritimibacter sp. HL-12]|uniref:hypothetical protein n=1 Tax=Maritimibacter sp. HL-12 TaxID=1162418 RepID=UPI000A0F2837|nr:hypothetical protein [Maritimibacter sp. HL-12]SMH46817.1 hypothetical protein SAMN05661107_1768 [Maritimibacter sp. HL-12]
MNMRSSTKTVKFSNPFTLSGYPGELPAGDYEIVVEEEILQGLSFEAWRRTATYLTVHVRGGQTGRTERWELTESDLNGALSRDTVMIQNNNSSEAALSPPEDMK